MVERDFAAREFGRARVGTFRDHLIGFQDRLHALGGHRDLRHGVGHLGEVLHGLEEARQVGEEDRETHRRSWRPQLPVPRRATTRTPWTRPRLRRRRAKANALIFLARSADWSVAWLTRFNRRLFQFLRAERLHDTLRFQAVHLHRDHFGLVAAHQLGGVLQRFLDAWKRTKARRAPLPPPAGRKPSSARTSAGTFRRPRGCRRGCPAFRKRRSSEWYRYRK